MVAIKSKPELAEEVKSKPQMAVKSKPTVVGKSKPQMVAVKSKPSMADDVTSKPQMVAVKSKPLMADVTSEPPMVAVKSKPSVGDVKSKPPMADDVTSKPPMADDVTSETILSQLSRLQPVSRELLPQFANHNKSEIANPKKSRSRKRRRSIELVSELAAENVIKRRKSWPCGNCEQCLRENCKICGSCKDMKKYGGIHRL